MTNVQRAAEPIALIDLDGTIADFDGAMQRELALLRGPEEAGDDNWMYEDVPHIKARRRMIKKVPGFWRNLERLQAGFDILNILEDMTFTPHILSKGPANVSSAWAEKVDWCRANVPHIPIVLAEDKGLVYGKVLVDDWPEYVGRWIQWRPRGLVISVAQPWNTRIEELSPNIIRYNGRADLPKVVERLAMVRATAGD